MRLPGRGKQQERQPQSASTPAASAAGSTAPPNPAGGSGAPPAAPTESQVVDLERRRDTLKARVAELQCDLGGLVYEMAIRDRIRVDVIVKRAAQLQDADAELSEVERILRLEETATAGSCRNCGAPHTSGAAYCWQCGQPLLQQVPQQRDRLNAKLGLSRTPGDVVAGARIGRVREDHVSVSSYSISVSDTVGAGRVEAEERGAVGDARGLLHVVRDDHDRVSAS